MAAAPPPPQRPSSKGKNSEKHDDASRRLLTLRTRLRETLARCLKSYDDIAKKWLCADATMHLNALRAMSAYLAYVSSETSRQSDLKEFSADMLVALAGILQLRNDAVLNLATNVTQQLVCDVGISVREFSEPMHDLIISLLCLLSVDKKPVATSCAVVLNHILKNFGAKTGLLNIALQQALDKSNVVATICHAVELYIHSVDPVEYFTARVTLLTTILWISPPSRYVISSKSELISKLEEYLCISDNSVTVSILNLFYAIALCGSAARRLLTYPELFCKIVKFTEVACPDNVKKAAFQLRQIHMRLLNGCSLPTKNHSEIITQGIEHAMDCWRLMPSKKTPNDKSLLIEACRTISMSLCFGGNHHFYFWSHLDKNFLFNILIGSPAVCAQPKQLRDEQQDAILRNVTSVHPYIWDIIGYMTTHCNNAYLDAIEGSSLLVDNLLSCACSIAAEAMKRRCNSVGSSVNVLEPALRALLMMELSPCSAISSKARSTLSEIAGPFIDGYLEFLISSLRLLALGKVTIFTDTVRTVLNLICLACLSIIPQYQQGLPTGEVVGLLVSIIRKCTSIDTHISRYNVVPHLQLESDSRTCCREYVREWEGSDVIVFYTLVAIFHLVKTTDEDNMLISSVDLDLTSSLESILNGSLGPGPSMYAGSIAGLFSTYGFPSKFGLRMKQAIDHNELADLEFALSDGQTIKAHGAILVARCPKLLPFYQQVAKDKVSVRPSARIQLSNQVESIALHRILEYAYSGCTIIDDSHVKSMRKLSKTCDLALLHDMLRKEPPKWCTAYPTYDLLRALEPAGLAFSDIIMESTSPQRVVCKLKSCNVLNQHVHAHKIVLFMRCEYLQALYRSGMLESTSNVVKVPVTWEALHKLVHWFYSDKLRRPSPECQWQNFSADDQLTELLALVELSLLADTWLLYELQDASFEAFVSLLQCNAKASVEIIRVAASFCQWQMFDACVNQMADQYLSLRDNGQLDELDERIVDTLRLEYVRRSQNGHWNS